MTNKCEDLGLAHAWRQGCEVYGFSFNRTETCQNCNLKRTQYTQTKEWFSYSDGREDEDCTPIRGV